MRQLLVTGGTGFLGKHFFSKIEESNEFRLTCLTRKVEPNLIIEYSKNISLCNPESTALYADKFVGLVHLATQYGRDPINIEPTIESNLLLPLKLLERSEEFGFEFFMNIDSFFNKKGFEYGKLLNYSLTKKALKSWFPFYASKISIFNCIIEQMYGPGDSIEKFAEKVVTGLLDTKIIEMDFTAGSQKRDWIYVEDVADALATILKNSSKFKNGEYNFEIGSGVSHSVRYFVELAKEIARSNCSLNFGKIDMVKDEITDSSANLDQMNELGWGPNFSLEMGLHKYIETMKNGK